MKNNIVNVTKYKTQDVIIETIFNTEKKEKVFFAIYNIATKKVSYKVEYSLEDVILRPLILDVIIEGRIYLPSKASEYNSENKLIEVIERFIERYLDLPETSYLKLVSHYILLTWIYDKLSVVPYLRAIGEPGSGKTRFAQVIGALCYNPLFLAGATSDAFIYRMNDIFKGTMIFNELERVNTDLSSAITVILNNGYEKGLFVGKVEGDRKRIPTTFDVFSPKIITSRFPFKDIALESRIINIQMRPTKRKDISVMLDESFWQQAQSIRDFLLMYRFSNLASGNKSADEAQLSSIEPRVRQTLLPLFYTTTEEKIKKEFLNFAKEYQEQLNIDKGLESDALIAEKLIDLLTNTENVTVKEVTIKVNLELEEKERLSNKAVGAKIRRFGFKPKKIQGVYRINYDKSLIDYLKERFNLTQVESINNSPLNPQNAHSVLDQIVDIGDIVDK